MWNAVSQVCMETSFILAVTLSGILGTGIKRREQQSSTRKQSSAQAMLDRDFNLVSSSGSHGSKHLKEERDLGVAVQKSFPLNLARQLRAGQGNPTHSTADDWRLEQVLYRSTCHAAKLQEICRGDGAL